MSKTKQRKQANSAKHKANRKEARKNKTSVSKGFDLLINAVPAQTSSDFAEHCRANTGFIGRTERSMPASRIPSHPIPTQFNTEGIPSIIKEGLSDELKGLIDSGFQYFVNEEYVLILLSHFLTRY